MNALVIAMLLTGGNGVGSGGLNGFQPVNPGSFTPSNAPNLVYATTAPITLYVDPTGSDSNDCTATGTAACLTIQGALNKVPKMLRHGVVVNVAAGTYGGFFVSGFTCDPSIQTTTGGLMIDALAALTNSTLATGTATGTATAGSAGSGTTFGSLTNSGASWTSSDLVGRFVTITSGTGSGQYRVISANTGTVITVVGTWTAPDATSVYAIQDPGVNINTATSSPATGLSAASANNVAVMFSSNACSSRTQSIVLRGVRISNSSGAGIYAPDVSEGLFTISQIRNTASTARNVDIGAAAASSISSGVGRWDFTDVDILVPSSGIGVSIHRGISVMSRVAFRAGATGLSLESATATASVSGADFNGLTSTAVTFNNGGGGVITAFSGAHVTCSSGAGVGFQVGGVAATTVASPLTSVLTVTGAVMSTCGIGLIANGTGATADVTGLTGSAGTTGMQAQSGGAIAFTSTTTITGGTQDLKVDATTAALADVATATCLASAGFDSKACQR